MTRRSLLSLAATVLVAAPLHAETSRATDRLALPIPQVEIFARTPSFGEGVVFNARGELFVSDAFQNRVLRIAEDGQTRIWSEEVRMPNGHKVLGDGTHVVMEGGVWEEETAQGAIVHLDPEGTLIARITTDAEGRNLRWPNDVAVDRANGGFYFTDPGRFMANEPGRIHYVSEDFEISTVSNGVVDFPNGIVLSADGSRAFVSESLQNRILVFPVLQPGVWGDPEVFANLPSYPNVWIGGEAEPDGIALDQDGRLYVAHFGAGLVHVLSSEGELLGSYPSGSGTVTNLAFDPTDPDKLYVYAATGISFAEINRGGEIVRMILPGASGYPLVTIVEN